MRECGALASVGDVDVLATATNVIDIWPYVAAVPATELLGYTNVDKYVEHVHRNGSDTFDHVLVVTKTKNVFLMVVVDLVRDTILGQHLLGLTVLRFCTIAARWYPSRAPESPLSCMCSKR